jgi:hypothetical protein
MGAAMSEIIQLEERRRPMTTNNPALIKKIVDGETIECVNVDALTPAERLKYFALPSAEGQR